MHSSTLNIALLSLLSTCAVAKNIRINVGDGGLVFSPKSTTADKGDVLQFFFSDSPHSVVAGDYNKACEEVSSGGFYSGDLTSMDGKSTVFEVTVNNTDPLFYYCSVGSHCRLGMVGVINPSKDETIEKYEAAASKAGEAGEPEKVFGGTVTTLSGSAASGSATMSSSGSKTTATSSSSAATSSSSAAASSGSTTTGSSSAAATTDSSQSTGTTTTASAQATKTNAAGQLGPVVDGVLLGAAGVLAMLV